METNIKAMFGGINVIEFLREYVKNFNIERKQEFQEAINLIFAGIIDDLKEVDFNKFSMFELKELGFKTSSKKTNLMLIPKWAIGLVKKGTIVTDENGKTAKVKEDSISLETDSDGVTAWGIIKDISKSVNVPQDKLVENLNTKLGQLEAETNNLFEDEKEEVYLQGKVDILKEVLGIEN